MHVRVRDGQKEGERGNEMEGRTGERALGVCSMSLLPDADSDEEEPVASTFTVRG